MSHFLQPLSSIGAPMIIDADSGQSVASSVEVATTRRARRRGLLGRDALGAGCAFVLAPCWMVHTIGMRFPIDVVFIDDDGRVVKVVEQMAGWKIAVASSASVTIELWAGAVKAVDIHVGDRLCLAPAFARELGAVQSSGALNSTKVEQLGVRPEPTRGNRRKTTKDVAREREHAGTLVA